MTIARGRGSTKKIILNKDNFYHIFKDNEDSIELYKKLSRTTRYNAINILKRYKLSDEQIKNILDGKYLTVQEKSEFNISNVLKYQYIMDNIDKDYYFHLRLVDILEFSDMFELTYDGNDGDIYILSVVNNMKQIGKIGI